MFRCANSVYPLLHEKALYLLIRFLDFKQVLGSSVERNLYSSLGVLDLVDRLLHKRAASFLGPNDRYQLLTGVKGFSGWEAVGTDNEKEPLILKNCLSYDEMKLSALLSVTSHSVFINNGTRKNKGAETANITTFQRHGVIIGIIGARLTKRNIMEAQEVIVRPKQNISERGYGTMGDENVNKWRKIWANFYGIEPNFPLYTEAKKPCKECEEAERYTTINASDLFDNITYQRRLAISFETLLIEAQNRAEKAKTTAFIHVVGIGLGVWKASPHQERKFLNAFGGCVQRLLPGLPCVTDLRFAWFSEDSILGVPKGKYIGHIKIDFSKDEPQTKLEKPDQLLVVSYAWDGNALPGNEFWIGWLASTGDSSAACCSQITELHNPHINQTKVCSSNLHIASPQWGVLHVAQYAQQKLLDLSPEKK